MSSSPNVLKESLSISIQKLNAARKEKELYMKNAHKIIIKTPFELEFQKKQLENKIKLLTDENKALRQVVEFKNPDKKTDLTQEIILCRKKISELEVKHEKNVKVLKELEGKLGDPKTVIKEGIFSGTDEEEEKTYQRLVKIEKILTSSLKANENKYKQKQKEFEVDEQRLASEKICLQMKILKTTQQERLLDLSISQNNGRDSRDHNYTDANFLYKPSIKALYN